LVIEALKEIPPALPPSFGISIPPSADMPHIPNFWEIRSYEGGFYALLDFVIP
jgi:hypothetical protein